MHTGLALITLALISSVASFKLSATTFDQLTVVSATPLWTAANPNTVYLQLPTQANSATAVWSAAAIKLANTLGKVTFHTSFNFNYSGEDGFAFVLQNKGNSMVGGAGSAFGYDIYVPSVAVRFSLESGSAYIAVEYNGSNSLGNSPAYTTSYSFGGENQLGFISYNGTVLQVSVDGITVISLAMKLSNYINVNKAYVGFTSGTQGNAEDSLTISNWTFTAPAASVTINAVKKLTQVNLVDCGYYTAGVGLSLGCGQTGSGYAAWITTKQKVLAGFTAKINFTISAALYYPHADGFSFAIQNQGLTIGNTGGDLGIDIFKTLFAVAFRTTYDNEQISIQTNGTWPSTPIALVNLNSGTIIGGSHTASIVYTGTKIQVSVDGNLLLEQTINIATTLNLAKTTPMWVGLTSAAGGATEYLVVSGWSLTL